MLTAGEQRLLLELHEQLQDAIDLNDVLDRSCRTLFQLIPADQGALCVSMTGRPDAYEWAVADLPQEFFAGYAEVAPHDFVRQAVLQRANTVLRDDEMLSRRELERSVMYQRCRELGMPLEQVMAVQIAPEPTWHGGLNLYRSRRRPFSDRDRAVLQELVGIFAKVLRRCRLLDERAILAASDNALLKQMVCEQIIVDASGIEVHRSAGATALIEAWFSRSERSQGGLPSPLMEALAKQTASEDLSWHKRGPRGELHVEFLSFMQRGRRFCKLIFEEIDWPAKLTARQLQVVECTHYGWETQTIADQLRCKSRTVTKHFQNIFDRLGVSNRASLVVRTQRRRWR